MSEDLQHIDDIFRDAIEPQTGARSATVWDKLEARLDKEDATIYKRRFVATRRVAITLFLLLLSLFIYDINTKKTDLRQFAGRKDEYQTTDNIVKIPDERTENKKVTEKPVYLKNTDSNKYESLPGLTGTVKIESKKPTIIQENGIAEKNGTTKNLFILSQKDKTQLNSNDNLRNASLISSRKKQHASARDELNNPYAANRLHNKNPNTSITNQTNEEEKQSENKSDYLVHRAALPTFDIPKTKIDAGLSIASPGNSLSGASLKLSDSLNQAIANAQKQNKKRHNSFKPYWLITAITSNEWTQDNLENDVPDNAGNSQDEKTKIEKRENHEPSFSAGVLASYQFKKHWVIQTGLIFSNTAISIDPQKIYAAKESNGQIAYKYNSSSGYAYLTPAFGLPPAVGDSLTATSAQHNLQYLSLPIILKYRLERRKLSISPGIGITANFLASAKIQTEVVDALNTETVNISKLEGAKPFYLGLMASADIQYKLNNKWLLNFMPAFRYALTPVTKNNVVKTYPYSFGIGLGMSYRF